MKKTFKDYITEATKINTTLGSWLSDEWEVGTGVKASKAEKVAEKYGEHIRNGVYDFIEYISNLENEEDLISPEAAKYILSFLASLKLKINDIEKDVEKYV